MENTAYRKQMRGFWIVFGLCLAGIPLQAQGIVKCGTPAIMEAVRSGKSLSYETELRATSTHFHMSPSGKFRLSYDIVGTHAVPVEDLDENGIPDYVERAAEYADESWHVMVDSLGYVDLNIDRNPYPIYFTKTVNYGYFTGHLNSQTAGIHIHPTFIGFPENDDPDGDQLGALKATIAHEMKHAIQYATSRFIGDAGSVLWTEQDATMMEEVVYPQVNDYVHYANSSNSVFMSVTKSVPNAYQAASFSLFYHERVGPQFWVNVWSVISSNPQITMRNAIYSQVGPLFEEYFVANHLWHHASGLRARQGYGFADKAVLPTSTSTNLTSPTDVPVGDMPRLSARYYHYTPVPSDTGQVKLMGFRQDASIQFGMLLYMKDGSTTEAVPVSVHSNFEIQTYDLLRTDERFEDVDLIAIVVTNTGTTAKSGTSARFSLGPISKISTIPYGDVNVDGITDHRDLTDLLAQLVGKFPQNPSLSTTFRADLTRNGTVTATDAAKLFQGRFPSDADAFGRGPGALRFVWHIPFEEFAWIDPDPVYPIYEPELTTEFVSQGDSLLLHIPRSGWAQMSSSSWFGSVTVADSNLILNEVKVRSLSGIDQQSDWMQEGTTTRFVLVQTVDSTPETVLTLAFRVVRADTTTLVFNGLMLDERTSLLADSVSLITNPKTPVGLDRDPELPSQLALYNYPNPFNPTTEIRYRKSEIGRVRLAVYDILGREVRILVDNAMPAGEHSIQFDARNLSSGVYVLVLDSEGQRLVRSITLIK